MTAFLLAFPVLLIFSVTMPALSYNTLSLQGVIVASIGLMMTLHAARWAPTLGAILTGLGGTIVFLAKPSSALLIAIAALAFILVTNKTPLRTLIVAVVTSVFATSIAALLISGSLEAFMERLMVGHDNIVTLRPSYGLAAALRLESPHLTFQEAVAFPLLAMVALGAVLLASLRPRLEVPIQLTFTAVACAVSILWLLFAPGLRASPATAFVAAAVPLGLAVAALAAGVRRPESWESSKRVLAAALLFACVPYIVAFGTSVSVSRLMGYVAVFWAFCAFVLIRAAFRDVTARVAVSVLLAAGLTITVAVIASRMEFPFRQHAALRLQDVPIAIGPGGDQTLLVDRETARYFAELGAELQRLGFRRGDGVIDMTGESPGIVFAIGGVPLGEPWLLGHYSGSTEFATRALARVSCEQLANAWILVAPAGDRALSNDVLRSIGLSPRIDSGSAEVRRRSREDHHVIVPPQRDGATLQSCLRLRAAEAAR